MRPNKRYLKDDASLIDPLPSKQIAGTRYDDKHMSLEDVDRSIDDLKRQGFIYGKQDMLDELNLLKSIKAETLRHKHKSKPKSKRKTCSCKKK